MRTFLRGSSSLPGRLRGDSSGLTSTIALLLLVLPVSGCAPSTPRPTGAAKTYADAEDLFGKARYDRALGFTDGFVSGERGDYNERGRVLRIVILSGDVNAYKELSEAYQKGIEVTKNPQWKADCVRLHHDYMRYAAGRALGLGEVAHALTQGGALPKEVTLETPYPKVEGPMVLTQLTRVEEGGWLEAGDQEGAASDGQRMAIENVLADLVQGDRSKARTELNAGPVKVDGAYFGLFLGTELLSGASVFDSKHMHDPAKMKALCTEADSAAKATAALLKASPDPEKQKKLKKLQDDLKKALKNG
jgi:hypothetical protein